MKAFLKLLKWLAIGFCVLLASAAIFLIYPELSESTKWTISICIFAGIAIYHLNSEEEKRREFRSVVLESLRQIHSRMDRLESASNSIYSNQEQVRQ